MVGKFESKGEARKAVWDLLQEERIARFPFPPHGRIPNFDGAKEAAERLFELDFWKTVRKIKVNPDAPQRYVRELALRRGIIVYMPSPRLRAGFMELNPVEIPEENIKKAAFFDKDTIWKIQGRKVRRSS